MRGSGVAAPADVGRDGDAVLDGTLSGREIGVDAADSAVGIVRGVSVGVDGDEAGVLAEGVRDVDVVIGGEPGDACGGTAGLRGLRGKDEKTVSVGAVAAGWELRGGKPGPR